MIEREREDFDAPRGTVLYAEGGEKFQSNTRLSGVGLDSHVRREIMS